MAFPLDQTYAQLFARQVAQHPDRLAAVSGELTLTYAELDARASRIAAALIGAGIGRDDLVALVAERGLPMLAMMIAVFKAGAAFLPLDVNHPPQRLREVLQASGTPLVLASSAQGDLREQLLSGWEQAPRSLMAEALWLEGPVPALPPRGAPADLAYVIFTSGSTGKPKGAMVEQRGMVNHMFGKLVTMEIGEHDRLSQIASPAFDICVWQFLSALLVGGVTDILADEVAYDPHRLLEVVRRHGITVLQIVPSMMRSLLDNCPADVTLPKLRWQVPTGEALPLKVAQDWFDRFPAVPLMNVYGPAECSDDVTYHALTRRPDDHDTIPIGRPTPNNQIYIVDAQLQPVPVGVAGEICVGGVGVGRGYLNNPEQTRSAFIDHPFAPGQRFYRTGDLGRYRADGVIEFLGRRDFQVKIRGFRIELGEIESRLARCAGVHEALVVAREDQPGERRLVAYYVPQDGASEAALEAATLRAALTAQLPDYMVPSAYVALAALPLTPNGKLDRNALPAPEGAAYAVRKYEAPLPGVESTLAAIWAELLGVERVGRHDHFFELGGHSLLVIKLLDRMRRSLLHADVHHIFVTPTLSQLAAVTQEHLEIRL
jgi:amino acid adenylation domain-containing protein